MKYDEKVSELGGQIVKILVANGSTNSKLSKLALV